MNRRKPLFLAGTAATALLISTNPDNKAAIPGQPRAQGAATQQSTIAPALLASTFLGGSGEDEITGIAFDQSHDVYVVGTTNSSDLPVTPSAFQKTISGAGRHAFVAKLNPSGSAILDLTYLGGSAGEYANAIAVDGAGYTYVVGTTLSTDFPVTPGAAQTKFGGADVFGDAFVTKLDPTLSHVIYSTYLGGDSDDLASAIAIDSLGQAYVAGSTRSRNFPVTLGALQARYGGSASNVLGSGGDAFIAKLDPSGSRLLYSTFLGGNGEDSAAAIVVDGSGNAIVVGGTNSPDFPVTSGVVQSTFGGSGDLSQTGGDAFVAKLNPFGTGLIFSTFLGGSSSDSASSVTLDDVGNIYVQGFTNSTNLPTFHALQPSLAGDSDVFLTKLDPFGTTLLYSTYFGGNGRDGAIGTTDSSGLVYLVGDTDSTNFPLVNSLQPYFGNMDVFLAKVDPTDASLLYSSYLGGGDFDFAGPIAIDPDGSMWIGGSTFSQNFPIVNALQPTKHGGMTDAFLVHFAETTIPPQSQTADLVLTVSSDQATIANGDSVNFSVTVTNNGPSAASNVVLSQFLPSPLSFSSATVSQGSCSGGPYLTCNVGVLNPGATVNAAIATTVPQSSGITLGGTLTVTADVSSATFDPNLADNSSQVTLNLNIHGTTGGGPGGSGCFIATAAYGSYLNPHVQALREFRDRRLMSSSLGRRFVWSYYRYSPPIAAAIQRSVALRMVTRWLLTPIVFAVEYPMQTTGMVFLFLLVVVVRRRLPRISSWLLQQGSSSKRSVAASSGYRKS
jgi:uncharacterized repeat protein (TIGR01451 family)